MFGGAHTLTRRFNSLEGINTISQVLHCVGSKVLGCLDLQEEDRSCDVHGVGLRGYHVAVAEGSSEKAENHESGVGCFETLA